MLAVKFEFQQKWLDPWVGCVVVGVRSDAGFLVDGGLPEDCDAGHCGIGRGCLECVRVREVMFDVLV